MQFLTKKLGLQRGEPTFFCPGCQKLHRIIVYNTYPQENPNRVLWAWNYNINHPTFTPSRHQVWDATCCHLKIQGAQIVYDVDCTHDLAGQTVEMVDIPDVYWDH